MPEKFRNKYRIESNRLKNWDYGSNAAYFITICTANREHYFGEIDGRGAIHRISEIGHIANKYWNEIPNHFRFVELGNFVVMPNHIHGIIIINKKMGDGDNDDFGGRYAINRVSTVTTTGNEKLTKCGGITGNKNPMLNNNLSRIIRWYKGRVTFESRKIHPDFAWQSNYHDHIIRNDHSFDRISDYIVNNPSNWAKDKFNM